MGIDMKAPKKEIKKEVKEEIIITMEAAENALKTPARKVDPQAERKASIQ